MTRSIDIFRVTVILSRTNLCFVLTAKRAYTHVKIIEIITLYTQNY